MGEQITVLVNRAALEGNGGPERGERLLGAPHGSRLRMDARSAQDRTLDERYRREARERGPATYRFSFFGPLTKGLPRT